MDSRLIDLEIRYTYLERTVAELDAVVLQLRAQVERLQKELTELRSSALDEGVSSAPNEKPPHY